VHASGTSTRYEWSSTCGQARQQNPAARVAPVDRTALAAKLKLKVEKQQAKRTGEPKSKK
jgi:hypothetical protein